MSMIFADQSLQESHHDGLRSIVSTLAVAALILIAIPVAALAASYVAGGLATSTLLFAYMSAVLTNGPFLLAALAITSAMVSMSRLFARAAS